ncbi:WD40 repeat-like protein [Pseudovirgaria hyperparasitica]|uniref:WD40 repeat-like protein n=1 Tax=Pseudovirgaria hyperparasitica TaxID=470096 RepID=A0A6A6W775_9PEZI|nr:WD40 repeat-like protein [Pseudovirgaria hyperparasitica]KAF2756931.1 WD40 repeat-like protein [Pseudovirgaria hyperparasitica]
MEVSDQYSSSHHPLCSPDNAHIATLNGGRLQIRSTNSLEVIHNFVVPQDGNSRFLCLRWSPKTKDRPSSNRILVADEDNVRVWDLRDRKWNGTINNGSAGMGKVVNADFGRTETEVVVFSDFASKVTVWSLSHGRTVEIKDPKFVTARGYGYRPKTSEFTVLSRPNAQDTVTLHAPQTYFVIKTITLNTVDAQGMKWSPDGKWLAVWDTPSVGHRVYIYTADGHLYRMYGGAPEGDLEGLGARSVDWSPRGDYLAISGYDKRVTLLNARTFSPVIVLEHTTSIQLSNGGVWQEQVSPSGERSYIEVAQPIAPPAAPSPPNDALAKLGISITTFNADGTLVATRDENTPTTVWIWDLSNLAPRAVIIQHSPIKQLLWNPSDPSILMIQNTHEDPAVHLWRSTGGGPEALNIKFKRSVGKVEARWLSTPRDRKPALIYGDAHGHVLAWPIGRDVILRFSRPETPNGADDSEDSLFDILTGRTPVPALTTTDGFTQGEDFDDSGPLDDTFRYRKQQSEMDESFF